MVFDFCRCVPKRHNIITDIFIDCAGAVLDRRRHTGQENIDDVGQFFRCIGKGFGNGRKSANVAKQYGQVAGLAPNFNLSGSLAICSTISGAR